MWYTVILIYFLLNILCPILLCEFLYSFSVTIGPPKALNGQQSQYVIHIPLYQSYLIKYHPTSKSSIRIPLLLPVFLQYLTSNINKVYTVFHVYLNSVFIQPDSETCWTVSKLQQLQVFQLLLLLLFIFIDFSHLQHLIAIIRYHVTAISFISSTLLSILIDFSNVSILLLLLLLLLFSEKISTL